MPNWCRNKLIIKAPNKKVKDELLGRITENKFLRLSKIVPPPYYVYFYGDNGYLRQFYEFIANRYLKGKDEEIIRRFTQNWSDVKVTRKDPVVKSLGMMVGSVKNKRLFNKIEIGEDEWLILPDSRDLDVSGMFYYVNGSNKEKVTLNHNTIAINDKKVLTLEYNGKLEDSVIVLESWHTWCVGNWGTKWDIGSEQEMIDVDDQTVKFNFDTAWGPPIEAILTLIENETTNIIDIELLYYEDGMGFAGRFTKNGTVEESYSYENKEALRKFIIDYGFETEESLTEMEMEMDEEDLEDSVTCVRTANQ